ncbi:MAG TPA: GNAT family N-acetyltransferase [Candidatus Thiothrix moscowensis]|uniref:GNAT family N-acetyltransferase n=1 Tax=unclassified Thiothrix TaxID=2636184 RepID=UPI0025E24D4C|nr:MULTISPECIES: GNAT family N-acetyltransferase [unclassified Thiothrix]HRJ52161.1 GNAT family N-acetyltransferase [Candidatus Thiothrix moscowensis]HRJ92328.1 GNAT family N-acetyltransferase [Candidatus Thiothrix moscowensis]
MKTVPLDKDKHDRNTFDCGIEALNNYLRLMANQQASKDNTRTFVLEDPNQPQRIRGYYTLTMTPVDFNALPAKLQKKHHHAQSGGLIARLAVDKREAKQGCGAFLLIDAMQKLLTASAIVAFPLIVVDAKDGAIAFYEKFGFTAFNDTPNKLFITMADVRNSLEVPP